MKHRGLVAAVVQLLLLLIIPGCESPTEPRAEPMKIAPLTEEALIGSWTGTVPVLLDGMPDGEDWRSLSITIARVGGTLSGSVTPRTGPSRPLKIFVCEANGGVAATLDVLDVYAGGAVPCFDVWLSFSQAEYLDLRSVALVGTMGGRGPNTILATPIRLAKR